MTQKKFFVLGLSICFSFLILEIFIRVFYKQIGNYHTEMFRYAAQHKQITANPRLPFYHVPNKNDDYYGVNISTNSEGFRDKELSSQELESSKKIIALGDSLTLGWGVKADNTYSQILEKKLDERFEQNFEVINMGVGNYNSAMELALFEEKGLSLKPDAVILSYFINDIEPTSKTSSLLQKLIRKSYFLAYLNGKLIDLRAQINPDYSWTNYYKNLYQSQHNIDVNQKSLNKLIEITQQNSIPLIIVNFPEFRQIKGYPFPEATRHIKNIAELGNVNFIDLTDQYREIEPIKLWVSNEDPHPNALAHEIAANSIFNEILQNDLF